MLFGNCTIAGITLIETKVTGDPLYILKEILGTLFCFWTFYGPLLRDKYRVSHIEMVETKWLKGVVELRILIELWCLVASRGLEFCVLSTSFQKSNIGWPQQPLTERTSDIS